MTIRTLRKTRDIINPMEYQSLQRNSSLVPISLSQPANAPPPVYISQKGLPQILIFLARKVVGARVDSAVWA